VDEVVGDADAFPGLGEAGGVGDVADVELATGRCQRGRPRPVADQAADRRSRLDQLRGQAAADEARGAGDESRFPDPLKLPGCGFTS
jgi:hypothetical protein